MTVIEQQLPSGTWTIDRIHSTADFSVKHSVVATFRGTFRELDASLRNENGEAVLTGVVPVAGIDVRDETLAGHLLSPDFFDAERHPEIRFVSTAVRPNGEGGVVVQGDLTLRGVTLPVQARGTILGPTVGIDGSERVGIELSTTIDRTAFGLTWNAPLPSGGLVLGNDVTLDVHLELVGAEA